MKHHQSKDYSVIPNHTPQIVVW